MTATLDERRERLEHLDDEADVLSTRFHHRTAEVRGAAGTNAGLVAS